MFPLVQMRRKYPFRRQRGFARHSMMRAGSRSKEMKLSHLNLFVNRAMGEDLAIKVQLRPLLAWLIFSLL